MSQLRRPPSVTMACVFIGLTSLIVFGSVTSALTDWGSIELQDAVRDALDDPALRGMGLTVAEVLVWLRRAAYVVVALSIAGTVFAVFAALGHRPSRIYLTIMCALAFLGFVAVGGLAGLFPAALAVVCAVQLWSSDSRAWFDAKNGVTAPASPASPAGPAEAPVGAPAEISSAPVAVTTTQLPKPVRVAGLVTLISSWLVVMFSGYFALVYATARDSYVESLSKEPTKSMLADYDLAAADVARWMFIGLSVLGVIALIACATAVLMLTGKPYARVATIVLAIVTVPLSFVVVGVGWPWTVAAVFVLIQLRRPAARKTT